MEQTVIASNQPAIVLYYLLPSIFHLCFPDKNSSQNNSSVVNVLVPHRMNESSSISVKLSVEQNKICATIIYEKGEEPQPEIHRLKIIAHSQALSISLNLVPQEKSIRTFGIQDIDATVLPLCLATTSNSWKDDNSYSTKNICSSSPTIANRALVCESECSKYLSGYARSGHRSKQS